MLEKCLENFNLTILFSVKPSMTIVFPLFNFTWKTLKQEVEGIEIIMAVGLDLLPKKPRNVK